MAAFRECKLPYEATLYTCGTIAKPLQAAMKSAFINLILYNEDRFVGVGNKSSPYFNNRVWIKSLNFGGGTSQGAEVTIVDTSGNDFNVFLNNLYKDACTSRANNCLLEFGWLITTCSGQTLKYSTANVGKSVYASPQIKKNPSGLMGFIIQELEVQSDSSGCWVYNLKLTAAANALTRSKVAQPVGTDFHKLPLKDAANRMLRSVCKDTRRQNRAQSYYFRDNETFFEPYGFLSSDGGFLGPKSVWDANRMNPVAALRTWMNSITTDRRLGTTFFTDPSIADPNIIVLEASDNICDPNINSICPRRGQKAKLVYLVNASDCTPVINFTPKVKYQTGAKAQGGGTSTTSAKSVRARDCRNSDPNDTTGIQVQVTVPGASINYRAPSRAIDSEAYAMGANLVANAARMQSTQIEGELQIEGDPRYTSIAKSQGTFIGIVYFNNPAARSSASATNLTCDWLAYPVVNNVFSSTEYLINGASHSIGEDGSYTTTLKVQAAIDLKKKRGN